MNQCQKCGSTSGVLLFTSFACDVCDPPRDAPNSNTRLLDSVMRYSSMLDEMGLRKTPIPRVGDPVICWDVYPHEAMYDLYCESMDIATKLGWNDPRLRKRLVTRVLAKCGGRRDTRYGTYFTGGLFK